MVSSLLAVVSVGDLVNVFIRSTARDISFLYYSLVSLVLPPALLLPLSSLSDKSSFPFMHIRKNSWKKLDSVEKRAEKYISYER